MLVLLRGRNRSPLSLSLNLRVFTILASWANLLVS
jgi:hypothetical protein